MFISKYFRKLDDNELIFSGDFTSLDGGVTFNPVINKDILGDYPRNFAKDRTFWRLVENELEYIQSIYNEAYYEYVHCPEKERKEAKERLDILRSKFFNS